MNAAFGSLLPEVRMRMRLGALLAAVAVVAIGAPSLPTAAAPTVPAALDRFFHYQRAATYGSTRVEVQVPMRDGIHLGCYLYRPAKPGTSVAAPGRFPGIIDNFTPYYLAYPFAAFSGAYFAQHGYLDLECTPRGTGTSEGVFTGWFTPTENLDNYDLIEWLAHLPGSAGKIAQEGDSYGGMTAYRVAALHPPGLVTIAPQQSYASMYLDYTYPGGIRSLGDPYWYLFAASVGLGRSATSTQEAAWLQHPLLDGYWQQIDMARFWPKINVPVLGFGGWVDIFQDGMVRNYLGLKGPATYLVDGPWTHGSTFDATVTVGALLAWFDRWLGGDSRAPLPPTHVASFLMPAGPWQALPDWPIPGGRDVALALTDTGTLSPGTPPGGDVSYLVNPAAGAVDLPVDDHLQYAGRPLAAPMVIAGAPTLHLVATLSDPSGAARSMHAPVDTNFVVHLYDVAPSGAKTLITRGYLKASQRLSHTTPSTLPLDAPLDYDVVLWHVHQRVAAGHHLALLVESGEQSCCLSGAPALSQPLLPLTVTVHAGTLRVPVAPQ